MVAVRLDERLKSRLDPSDVVQDVLMEATNRLAGYAADKPVAFYPWLRRLAWERIVHLYRTHIVAQRRSVTREQQPEIALPGQSTVMLVDALADNQSSPSESLLRKQMNSSIKNALERLKPHDRELLVLRYLEQLSLREIADVLDSSESAIKSRHARALKRLGVFMLLDPNTSNR